MVCVAGSLAEYLHHKQMVLPMKRDSLAELLEWAEQTVMLHPNRKSEQPMEYRSTDSDIFNYFYAKAGVAQTKNYATRRLRQGGAQSARETGMDAEALKRNMGHSSGAHETNYVSQLPRTMKEMADAAGHHNRTIVLGRAAVSARDRQEFQSLFWSVCPTGPGFTARIRQWCQQDNCQKGTSLLMMLGCLEDLSEVLLQDLAIKPTYGSQEQSQYTELHISQYYSGRCEGSPQIDTLPGGQASLYISYPYLDPTSSLHSAWQAFAGEVRAEQDRLHAECEKGGILEEINGKLDLLLERQPVVAEGGGAAGLSAIQAQMGDMHTMQQLVEAVQQPPVKKQRLESAPAAAAPPQYVLDARLHSLLDKGLLAPSLSSVDADWQLFRRQPGEGLPSPCDYMRSSCSSKAWLGFLGDPKKKNPVARRGRAYVKI